MVEAPLIVWVIGSIGIVLVCFFVGAAAVSWRDPEAPKIDPLAGLRWIARIGQSIAPFAAWAAAFIYVVVFVPSSIYGLVHQFGVGGATGALIAGAVFGSAAPLVLGGYFIAADSWGLSWFGALLYLAPSLYFAVPRTRFSLLSWALNEHARLKALPQQSPAPRIETPMIRAARPKAVAAPLMRNRRRGLRRILRARYGVAIACSAACALVAVAGYWIGHPWTYAQCTWDASKRTTATGVRVAVQACDDAFPDRGLSPH